VNKDKLHGRWNELTAKVKKQWGELTDDEVRQADGNVDMLKAKIQQKYGDSREQVAAKFNELMEQLDDEDDK
jgi:uncharacterized protein YjbJ (UPF0337 family)